MEQVWSITKARDSENVSVWRHQAATYNRKQRADGHFTWQRGPDLGPVRELAGDAMTDGEASGLKSKNVRHGMCAVRLEDYLPVDVVGEWRLGQTLALCLFARSPRVKDRSKRSSRMRIVLAQRYLNTKEPWVYVCGVGSWSSAKLGDVCNALDLSMDWAVSLPRIAGRPIQLTENQDKSARRRSRR